MADDSRLNLVLSPEFFNPPHFFREFCGIFVLEITTFRVDRLMIFLNLLPAGKCLSMSAKISFQYSFLPSCYMGLNHITFLFLFVTEI